MSRQNILAEYTQKGILAAAVEDILSTYWSKCVCMKRRMWEEMIENILKA